MRTLRWWGKKMIPRLAKVRFQMSGTVTQTIEILDQNITLEDIEEGLRYGKYDTTEMHSGIVEAGTRKVVANIVGQTATTSYFGYEVAELTERKSKTGG